MALLLEATRILLSAHQDSFPIWSQRKFSQTGSACNARRVRRLCRNVEVIGGGAIGCHRLMCQSDIISNLPPLHAVPIARATPLRRPKQNRSVPASRRPEPQTDPDGADEFIIRRPYRPDISAISNFRELCPARLAWKQRGVAPPRCVSTPWADEINPRWQAKGKFQTLIG